jgi:hypothetical protein
MWAFSTSTGATRMRAGRWLSAARSTDPELDNKVSFTRPGIFAVNRGVGATISSWNGVFAALPVIRKPAGRNLTLDEIKKGAFPLTIKYTCNAAGKARVIVHVNLIPKPVTAPTPTKRPVVPTPILALKPAAKPAAKPAPKPAAAKPTPPAKKSATKPAPKASPKAKAVAKASAESDSGSASSSASDDASSAAGSSASESEASSTSTSASAEGEGEGEASAQRASRGSHLLARAHAGCRSRVSPSSPSRRRRGACRRLRRASAQ